MPDHDTRSETGSPLPPPVVAATPPPTEQREPAPLAGQLTRGWRIVTVCAWIGVIVAFAAIWNTSVQLGLSTWWLGARGAPQPQTVRLLPFLVPLLMVIAALNNLRWLGYVGLGAAAATAAFGIGDLGRVDGLAAIELVVAGVAAAVSIASLSGTYRDAPTGEHDASSSTSPT